MARMHRQVISRKSVVGWGIVVSDVCGYEQMMNSDVEGGSKNAAARS